MKTFHDVKYPTRPVRVAITTHHMLKIASAELGLPLGTLADELISAGLPRRRRERDKDLDAQHSPTLEPLSCP